MRRGTNDSRETLVVPQEAREAAMDVIAATFGSCSNVTADAAIRASFWAMLQEFLLSDDARDVTGKWGFTTTLGDQFRSDLIALAKDWSL